VAHRAFTDSAGVAWEVWEVHPGVATSAGAEMAEREMAERDAADRRSGEERRGASPPAVATSSPPTTERRVIAERRVGVSIPMRGGWLAFQSASERRRLVPIPHGWAEDSETQLEAYCRAARVVPRSDTSGHASGHGGR
jgi:hypothetical protein